MVMQLNSFALAQAKSLIAHQKFKLDNPTDWTDHKPPRSRFQDVLKEQGPIPYSLWHLGEDDEMEELARARYGFPYGDFKLVHLCAVLHAEEEAAEYADIRDGAAELHRQLEGLRSRPLA
jgi:hypothetical protein